MAQEIERKFLLPAPPPKLDTQHSERIQQGYIALTPDHREVRIRRRGNQCFLTVKVGQGLRREETEIVITEQQFARLWPTTESARLEKTRHYFPLASHLLEIDEYHHQLAPLWVVELEFPSITASQAFCPPDWFGQEVTANPAFSNVRLATYGLPPPFLAQHKD